MEISLGAGLPGHPRIALELKIQKHRGQLRTGLQLRPLDALHAKSSDRSPLRSTHTLWGSQYNGHGSFSRHDTMSASAGSAGGVICAERTSSMGNSSRSKAAGESFASIPEAERLSWSASMLSDRKIATPESWWKVFSFKYLTCRGTPPPPPLVQVVVVVVLLLPLL